MKPAQFADDMNLFSIFDQTLIQTSINTLVTFEANTGLKLNYDKSNVHRIGL